MGLLAPPIEKQGGKIVHIESTTARERLAIRQAVDSSFVYVSRARRLLMRVLGDYFEDAEQKSIDRKGAEDMCDILQAVNDALWWAETEYSLTVGDEIAPGSGPSYEGAIRALRVRDVEHLRNKLGHEITGAYLDMDDEKALAAMRAIAKSNGPDA